MNPKFKKYFEIFIVLLILFNLIYFVLYKVYFNTYCVKYSQEVTDYKKMNLSVLSSCKDNYICDTSDEFYELGKLNKYTCIKNRVNIFEYSYYESKFNELIK